MKTRVGRGLAAICCVVALCGPLGPRPARAALGDPESSIPGDVERFKGSIKSTIRTNYQVHEIQLPSGTVLREFSAVGGKVFAVAWNGPVIPDLRQTLGRYFDVYVNAAQPRTGGHRHLQIEQDGFILQSSGHMREFAGRAYLPQAFPAGFSADEIR